MSRRLRARSGCPWDRQQTFRSLRPYIIEEAYEVVDCIERGRWGELPEELGDLLYQVFFLSQMASEKSWFSIEDVVRGLTTKLVSRHPHVFGRKRLRTSDQVLKQWARTKLRENGTSKSIMSSVPRALPALLRARRVSEKAARLGFDWPTIRGVIKKVEEEWNELEREIAKKDRRRIAEELGDLLLSITNVARVLRIDAESALRESVDRFVRRFQTMERAARSRGKPLDRLTAAEWESLWMRAKKFSTQTVDRL